MGRRVWQLASLLAMVVALLGPAAEARRLEKGGHGHGGGSSGFGNRHGRTGRGGLGIMLPPPKSNGVDPKSEVPGGGGGPGGGGFNGGAGGSGGGGGGAAYDRPPP